MLEYFEFYFLITTKTYNKFYLKIVTTIYTANVIVPSSAFNFIFCPCCILSVAEVAATRHGKPYSRATTAPCEIKPPETIQK